MSFVHIFSLISVIASQSNFLLLRFPSISPPHSVLLHTSSSLPVHLSYLSPPSRCFSLQVCPRMRTGKCQCIRVRECVFMCRFWACLRIYVNTIFSVCLCVFYLLIILAKNVSTLFSIYKKTKTNE